MVSSFKRFKVEDYGKALSNSNGPYLCSLSGGSDRVVMDFRASLVFFSLLLLSVGMLVAFFSSSGENRTRGILALLVVMFLIASYYMIEFDIHGVASDSIYSSLGLAGIAVASCSLLGVFPFHYVWVEYEKHLSKDRLLSYYFLRILLSYQLLSFLIPNISSLSPAG